MMVRSSKLCLGAFLVLAAFSLSGCGETRRALGYEKAPPDEFTVVQRAPLSLPPDFSLRPPEPGAGRPQEAPPRDQARSVLLGQPMTVVPAKSLARANPSYSRGEVAFLNKIGKDQAVPDIRAIVDQEASALVKSEKDFADRLVFWRDPLPSGDIVDATKETERLRANKTQGKATTEGETPVIKRKKRAWLEDAF